MIPLLRILSWLGLALTVLPPVLYFFDAQPLDSLKYAMAAGMLLWFATAPFVQHLRSQSHENI
jgi:hypothetical protein